jgi:DNA-binding MarR family transcriptional regulator
MGNLNLFRPPQEIRELSLLQELEKNPIISQRELSHKFGIALGVTNACLKRMVRRGWIRITSLNHHKIGYFLTPRGFAEKTKLTLHLISWTVQHYSTLKDIIAVKLLEMQNNGVERIVFYGVSDEMEIAYITLQGLNLKLVGIVGDGDKVTIREIFGFKLTEVEQIMSLNPEVILITSLSEVEERRKRLEKYIDFTKVKVLSLCN